ncbi:MAG: glycosyltransferase family 2 protein [Actinomycetota bacterium]|nr:glycosyltransferase family 2 protein [Actinomycetota bacterium]
MADAATGTPQVTVVIPVKDRRELLVEALDGLAAQTFTDFEVVVVDDGSSDGSGEVAARRTIAGRPVRVIPTGGVGAVGARTAGVAAAAGPVLAFTDSDCVPSPEWLSSAMAAIDAGADAVNGRTAPARPMAPLERSMGSGTEGLYPTCNMLYRRNAFDAAGGFDSEAGRRWGFRLDQRSQGDGFGEDTLLAWRLIRSGGRIDYVPEAEVAHAVLPPDPAELVSRTLRAAAFPALVREVPELRGTLLRWGFQLGARSRLPLYASVVAALARQPRLALACAVAWVAVRLFDLRAFPVSWSRRLAALPVELGVDVLTAGALVAGSVKARRVTL